MPQPKIKYMKHSLTLGPSANNVQSIAIVTEKGYKELTGIAITCSNSNAFADATFDSFVLDGFEIFPEGFELKILQTGVDLDPNQRFFDIKEPADGKNLTVKVNSRAFATGSVVNIYLRYEGPQSQLNVSRP